MTIDYHGALRKAEEKLIREGKAIRTPTGLVTPRVYREERLRVPPKPEEEQSEK